MIGQPIAHVKIYLLNQIVYDQILFIDSHCLVQRDVSHLFQFDSQHSWNERPLGLITAPRIENKVQSQEQNHVDIGNGSDNVDNFDDIKDQEIKIYNDEFNIVGSAYILKPINRRWNINEVNNEKKTKNIKEIGEDIGNVAKTTIDATKNAIKKQRIDLII